METREYSVESIEIIGSGFQLTMDLAISNDNSQNIMKMMEIAKMFDECNILIFMIDDQGSKMCMEIPNGKFDTIKLG